MKYAVLNSASKEVKDKADCIILEEKDNKSRLSWKYLSENPDKYYMIESGFLNFKALDKEPIKQYARQEKILTYLEENLPNNYTILCETIHELNSYSKQGCNVMYNKTITSTEMLYNLIQHEKLTDVIIDGSLAFSKDAYDLIHKYNKRVWVVPFVSYSAAFLAPEEQKSYCNSFYIRPEDVKAYEGYVDGLLFWGSDNEMRLDALFNVYKRGEYAGIINMLIWHLEGELRTQNNLLPPTFGEFRLDCKQKCKVTGTCNYCATAFELARKLADAKKKYEYPDGPNLT